jgi:UDP-N-acetylmuramate dehydrogenase
LTKRNHKINTSYGDITKELEKNNITNPTLKDVSNAVIAIRQSKLPDPKELGNSGSFFKNPIISTSEFEKINAVHPEIPHYVISETEVKVPAGWLIEQAGFKGKRFGDAGIHKNQALVLVNYGNATGQEILAVSKDIQATVLEKFGIAIEAEVNVI